MRVVHITPTYFDNSSIIGGGERYPTELALWMSKVADTTLVSFSAERKSYQQDNLKVEIYPVKRFIHGNKVNPLAFGYLRSIFNADVIHIHHIHTLVSDMACLVGYILGKRVVVTDYGGGGSLTLNKRLPVFSGYDKAIAYSQFGLNFLPPGLKEKAVLIKGGIDTEKFCPDDSGKREKKILFVGRLLPHKGIDYLVAGFRQLNRPDYLLRIIGRVYNEDYYQYLKQLAAGLSVEFVHDADDQRLIQEYRTATVTVLPSVHTNYEGNYTPIPELMGFTLLESQACGTPVICTDAGAMPEFVNRGRTGFVVQQNCPEAIAISLHRLVDLSPCDFAKYANDCRYWVKGMSWAAVVQKHLKIYISS